MATTQKIRLSRFNNWISQERELRLYEIEVYSGTTKVNATAIAAQGNIPNTIAKLIVAGNPDVVVIPVSSYVTNRAAYYIDIDLATPIELGMVTTVRFKAESASGWIGQCTIGVSGASHPLNQIINLNSYEFPGIGQFSALPVLPASYPASISGWDAVAIHNNGLVATDGVAVNKQIGTSGAFAARSKEALNSGKHCIEVTEIGTSFTGIIGLCSATFNSTQSVYPGQDSTGLSFGIYASNVYFRGATSAPDWPTLFGAPHGTSISSYQVFSSFTPGECNTYNVLIDLDERTFAVRNAYGAELKFKIPFSGPVHICYGGDNASPTIYYGYVNFGHWPFVRRIPDGYKAGFSATDVGPVTLAGYLNNYKHALNLPFQSGLPTETQPRPLTTGQVKFAQSNDTMRTGKIEAVFIGDASQTPFIQNEVPMNAYLLSDFRGFGYIKSNVLKGTSSLVPLSTVVLLIDMASQQVIMSTFSDASTGEFEFKYISLWRDYNIVAFDPVQNWVSAIAGPVKATRMPNSEGLVFNET